MRWKAICDGLPGVLGLSAAALVALSLPAVPVVADEPAADQANHADEPKADRSTVTLQFPGGTVPEFVDALQRVAGREHLNVIIKPDAREFMMPPFALRHVEVDAIPQLISRVAEHETLEGTTHVFVVRPNLWIVDAQVRPDSDRPHARAAQPDPRRTERRVQIHSLADVIDDAITADDLLTSIETAIELSGRTEEMPQIRIHPETRTLMVHGDLEQLRIVRDMISQVREATEQIRARAGWGRQIRELQQTVAELREQLEGARAEAEAARQEAIFERTRHEALQETLQSRNQEILRLRRDIDDLNDELRQLRREQ